MFFCIYIFLHFLFNFLPVYSDRHWKAQTRNSGSDNKSPKGVNNCTHIRSAAYGKYSHISDRWPGRAWPRPALDRMHLKSIAVARIDPSTFDISKKPLQLLHNELLLSQLLLTEASLHFHTFQFHNWYAVNLLKRRLTHEATICQNSQPCGY